MPKRILTGKVTSSKSDKTITVLVERKIMQPMYKKFVTKSKNTKIRPQTPQTMINNLKHMHLFDICLLLVCL